jgi:FtsP/CotA-like multicopper oxidase with cupredoxin domain
VPDLSRRVTPIEMALAEEVSIELTMNDHHGVPAMGINGQASTSASMVAIQAQVGKNQLLRVKNLTPYAHPFHLHGFFFQPLEASGTPLTPLRPKDTIDVPPLSEIKLAVSYDDRPGMWMFHCHILDHTEAGMMGMLHVTP